MLNFKDFVTKWNNKYCEVVGPSSPNQCFLEINSKRYGKVKVLLDFEDYVVVKGLGKWNVHIARKKLYVQKRFKKDNLVELHRFLTKAKKGEYVDHINHNTLDNRKTNLRVTTNAANLRNGLLRINNKSGYNGVHFSKKDKRWIAFIKVNYKRKHLGSYKLIDEAVKARQEAERLYWNI